MKPKFCDVGQHEVEKLFHARTKDRPSCCSNHKPRTPIKNKSIIEQVADHMQSIEESHQKIRSHIRNVKPNADKTVAELKKLAQIIVNKHVKKLYTAYDGTAKCFTCQTWFSAKEMDTSHLISVRHQATRYDLDNLKLCCTTCNRSMYGNLKVYKERLIALIGKELVDDLYSRSRQRKNWTKNELLEIINKFK